MKNAVLFIFCWLSIINNFTFGQVSSKVKLPDKFYKHFKGIAKQADAKTGKIKEFDFVMNINRRDDQIVGSYINTKEKTFYTLEGTISASNVVELQQYDHRYYLAGSFTGVFKSAGKVVGKWNDENLTSEYSFEMDENYAGSVKFEALNDTNKYHIEDKPKQPFIQVKINYLNPIDYELKEFLPTASLTLERLFFGPFALQNNPSENIKKKTNECFSDYRNLVEKQFLNAKQAKQLNKNFLRVYNRKVEYNVYVYYNDDGILSMFKDSLEVAGDEIITEGTSYFVIDMKSGKQIKLDELFFYPKYKEKMEARFIDKIKEWLNIKNDKELKAGGFDKDAIKYNRNFYIDKFGLGFYFNPYEVNERYVKVYFRFDEIAQYLNEKSPISNLFPQAMAFGKDRQLKPEDIVQKPKIVKDEDGETEEEDSYDDVIILDQNNDTSKDKTEEDEEGTIIMPEE